MKSKALVMIIVIFLLGGLSSCGNNLFIGESGKSKTEVVDADAAMYSDRFPNMLLLDAIIKSDMSTVKLALKNGADVNYETEEIFMLVDTDRRKVVQVLGGETFRPLPKKYTTVSYTDIEKLRAEVSESLALEGADIPDERMLLLTGETTDDNRSEVLVPKGISILEISAIYGSLNIIQYLFSQNVEYVDNSLLIAIQKGNLDLVKELLKHTEKLNFIGPYGETPLSIVAKDNADIIAQLLLENGAQVTFDVDGENAFDIALDYYNIDVIRVFLEYESLDTLWNKNESPLIWTINNNPLQNSYVTNLGGKNIDTRIDLLSILLETGIDIDEMHKGYTPFLSALFLSNDTAQLDIIRFLIQEGIDINARTKFNAVRGWDDPNKTRYLLDLLNILDIQYPNTQYADIKEMLIAKGAKTIDSDMVAAKKVYDKDLGYGYTQEFTGLDFNNNTPHFSVLYYNDWIINDPEGFEVINPYYAKEKNTVWFKGKLVEGADSASFEILSKGNGFYAQDSKYLYAYGTVLQDSDSDTYNFLSDSYIQSNNNIYFDNKKIDNVDIATFELLEWPYSKDKNHTYREEQISIK